VCLALALPGCGGDEPDTQLQEVLDDVVAAGAPGALVLVRDESGMEREAGGFADRDARRELEPGDRFRIGSVTKTFVAVIVLQLVDEGTLTLEDTVERRLPGLLPGGEGITLRELLSHTSGLPDYVDDLPVSTDPDWRPRDLIELALADPQGSPRRFSYASTNYLVLQLVIEETTGTELGEQLEQRIFEPLRLEETSFEPGSARGERAHGYRPPSHGGVVTGRPVDVSDEPATWAWGAGAIVSTADDVARFFRALLQGEVVPLELLEEMQALVPAGRNRYGLGLAVYPTPCGPAWGHTGNANGYVTIAWNTRDARRQVVLMESSYPLSPELEATLRRAQIAAFCG
jgi:D-alanyl-D-alanine carboxypeptidase